MKYSKKSSQIVGFTVLALGLVCIKSIYAQSDSNPPVVSEINIADVTKTSATIRWTTDENSDSIINYSVNRDYGVVRNPKLDEKEHEVLIDNLEPSTTYYFRIISTDLGGNQTISGDFTLITSGSGSTTGLNEIRTSEDRAVVDKVMSELEKLRDEFGIKLIAEKLKEIAKGVTNDLTIIGAPEVETGAITAMISWTTDRDSDSTVEFSPESQYSGGDYSFSQSSTDGDTEAHKVEIIGLEPFTVYHYRVISKDQLGLIGKSEDRTFITKALVPDIINPGILKVEETSATFQWGTTIPSSALIEYEDLTTGARNSIGSPVPVTDHLLKVAGLRLGAQYSAVIIAENESGNKVRSEPIYFITVKDDSAPIISKISNESTIFPGAEARIQTIVSWETDEPSQCLFYYRQGLALGTEELSLPPQDNNFMEKHVQVIVDFTPSTVYKFWLVCKDASENESRSEDFVLFTPEKEKSIIDLILENFEGAFGWVKDIGA